MVARGAGKIINITTVLAHKGFPGGVNVSAIAPHLVLTPGIGRNAGLLEQIADMLPAKRYALPAEIASAAVYLASDDASVVHGVTLPVDGGYLAT